MGKVDLTGVTVADDLRAKADLYEQRNKVYGNNYHKYGKAVAVLMEGQTVDLSNEHEVNRFGVLGHLIDKMQRYCSNFNVGGHADSLDDISVYAMMLKELDRKCK